MAKYDGSIIIDSKINTSGFKQGEVNMKTSFGKMASATEKMGNAVKSVFVEIDKAEQSVKAGMQEINDAIASGNEIYEQQIRKVNELEDALKDALEKRVDPQALSALDENINNIRNELIELIKKEEEFLKSGGKLNTEPYNQLENEIDQLKLKLRSAKEEKEKFLSTAYTDSDISSIETALTAEKERLAQMNSALGISYDGLKNKVEEYGSVVTRLTQKKGILQKVFASLISTIKKAGVAMLAFHKSTKKSNGSIDVGIKNMLKYTLGISSLIMLFRKIKSAVKEGMQNLAQYSGEINTHLSTLKSSVTQLKNSLATAFAPILTVIEHMLTRFINLLSQAATYVGMFFAALTGKNSFVKAVAVQENYAASLGETADNAKEAKKYLSSLDEIQTYTSDQDSSSGGAEGVSPADMFETVPMEEKFKDFADKVKDVLSGIWDVFKKAWENKGQEVIDSAKTSFLALKEAALAVGKTWYEVWTNVTGLSYVESLLNLLIAALDVVTSITEAFTEAWNSGTGFEMITAIYEALTKVHNLITSIADSFSRVFSNGTGVEIWKNILGIVTGVWNIIGNLAESLQKAWETSGVGDSIWQGILNIVNNILEHIHSIVDATAEWAGNLDFSSILESLSGLLDVLNPLVDIILDGLAWAWENVLLPFGKWTLEEAAPAVIDLFAAAIGALTEVLETLKPLGEWLWENFLQPIAEWAGDAFISGLEIITDILNKVSDGIAEFRESGGMDNIIASLDAAKEWLVDIFTRIHDGYEKYMKPVLEKLGKRFKEVMEGPLGETIEKIRKLIGKLSEAFQLLWENVLDPMFKWIADNIMPILAPIVKTIGEILMNVISIIIEAIGNIADVLGGLIDFIVGVFTGDWDRAWNGIKEIFSGIWNLIKGIVTGVWDAIQGVVSGAVDVVKSIISTAWNGIKTLTSTIWDAIKSSLSNNINAIKNIVSIVFTGIKNTIANIWNGIVSNIKSSVNTIISIINGMIRGVTSGINSIINALNSLHFDIPSWVPELGGKSFGFNLRAISAPQIPYLASGAVIPPNAPFMAVLGDQKHGTNIEAPLSLIEDSVNKAVRNAMSNQQRNSTYIFNAQINRRTLFSEMIEEAKLHQTVTGRNPFYLA